LFVIDQIAIRFDLIERNLILAAVVKLRGARAFVFGDVLRDFELTAVLQIRGDAGRAESVVPDPRLDSADGLPALDHAMGVLLPHRIAGECSGLSGRRAK
jgi:hypothetical protein